MQVEVYCTRPGCRDPRNYFPQEVLLEPFGRQKKCSNCGMLLVVAGRYLPLAPLHQGGFGKTFLAEDLDSARKRKCVIKQLQPSNPLQPAQLQRVENAFVREAEILEDLRHPCIPQLLAFRVDAPLLDTQEKLEQQSSTPPKVFYLIQEYIDGHNLTQELEQQGQFSESQALELLNQILPVLQFVHEHNIIHRDIKPSNIMRSQGGKLYLIDFGAVKQTIAGQPIHNQTGFSSEGFTAPEQQARGEISFSSDLYSLAVTCIYLLTGQGSLLTRASLSRKEWRSYTTVSDSFASILNRLLEDDPSKRYQSTAEVMAALAQVQLPVSQSLIPFPEPFAPASNPTPEAPTAPLPLTHLGSIPPQTPPITAISRSMSLPTFLLGAESCLLAVILSSFFPSWIAMGLWLLLILCTIFGVLGKRFSNSEKSLLFLITIASTLSTFFLFPSLFGEKVLNQTFLQAMLLSVITGLLAFLLLSTYQLFLRLF